MVLINNVLEIPDDNPFLNDKLNREIIAENLEKIIDSVNGSMVLSIDSGWGNGKTTFINMWKKRLDNTGKYTTLCFNAWENDDCGDPLLALISELEEVLNKDQKNNTTLEKIKKCGKPLLKKSIPMMLKIATNGFFDIENIKQYFNDANEKHLVDWAGKLGEFELYQEQKMSRTQFKEALVDYQKGEGKKIIFFIDELDRCRPTFAIETLEKIKHLFNIDNFIFVLALDKKQLSHSIKTLYGQEMDSVGYLRRFIDFEFMLSEPDRNVYTKLLLSKYNLTNENTKNFESYLLIAVSSYKLSLRDIDKLCYYLRLLLPIAPFFLPRSDGRKYRNIYLEVMGLIYAIFPVLKLMDNDLYQKFVNKESVDNTAFSKIVINHDKMKYHNYQSIFSYLISINNILSTGMSNSITQEYTVNTDYDYHEHEYDMINLLNDERTEFSFIKQMEFIDNFVLPE